MADIKKIKAELLQAFNSRAVPLEIVSRSDSLDSALGLYFSAATFMHREMILEAILHGIRLCGADKTVTKEETKRILGPKMPSGH